MASWAERLLAMKLSDSRTDPEPPFRERMLRSRNGVSFAVRSQELVGMILFRVTEFVKAFATLIHQQHSHPGRRSR